MLWGGVQGLSNLKVQLLGGSCWNADSHPACQTSNKLPGDADASRPCHEHVTVRRAWTAEPGEEHQGNAVLADTWADVSVGNGVQARIDDGQEEGRRRSLGTKQRARAQREGAGLAKGQRLALESTESVSWAWIRKHLKPQSVL